MNYEDGSSQGSNVENFGHSTESKHSVTLFNFWQFILFELRFFDSFQMGLKLKRFFFYLWLCAIHPCFNLVAIEISGISWDGVELNKHFAYSLLVFLIKVEDLNLNCLPSTIVNPIRNLYITLMFNIRSHMAPQQGGGIRFFLYQQEKMLSS
uniref:Uncharacterized protein n=1 Tax=Nelumbo nucifera TaxID=4432 RepID=A0A822YDD7_NELNU|nr:TPA_asm: hypothetical protein HUJ06_011005 [Nelumbo nucifera]